LAGSESRTQVEAECTADARIDSITIRISQELGVKEIQDLNGCSVAEACKVKLMLLSIAKFCVLSTLT
jgi:hypothetical protein